MLRKLPAGLGLGEAAVLNGAYETAYHGLVHCGGLKKGELNICIVLFWEIL